MCVTGAPGVKMAYRRSYSQRNRAPVVDSTRREIVGSVTSGTAGTFTDETITLPNVPDQSMGLRIHSLEVEFEFKTGNYDGDGDYVCAILSTQSGTGEKFFSDPEVIAKCKYIVSMKAAGTVPVPGVMEHKLYPPRIVMGTQFHLLSCAVATAAIVYYKITYSLVKLSMADALAALTTMQF